jgi:hypothetical protein
MMDTGKLLIVAGLVLVGVGVLVWAGAHLPWLGKLPGDLSIRKGNFSFYFPLTTCLLVSGVLSVLFHLLNKR